VSLSFSKSPSAYRHPTPRFALPHLERPNVPQMLLYADTILGILGLLFSRPFSFWICRMHGSWRRRRIVFLWCWVLICGFVVLDSFMSGYGALSSYCGFAVALQLCFFATCLLGSLFPSVMLRAGGRDCPHHVWLVIGHTGPAASPHRIGFAPSLVLASFLFVAFVATSMRIDIQRLDIFGSSHIRGRVS
jgi:hypothetical protein